MPRSVQHPEDLERRKTDENFAPCEMARAIPMPLLWVAIALAFWGVLLFDTRDVTAVAQEERADQAVADKVTQHDSGLAVFTARCSTCHQSNGAGLRAAVPPLKASASVAAGPPTIARILLRGIDGSISVAGNTFDRHMPGFASASTNIAPDSAGFGDIGPPDLGYDPVRDATVFAAKCALCRGADGQGQTDINGRYRFPPLWGAQSYNWGAGMHQIDTAAAFIKNNMPLSKPRSLSDQEAWDVAADINSQERPMDPRQTGTVEDARLKHHDGEQDFHGLTLNGVLIGVGAPRPVLSVGQ